MSKSAKEKEYDNKNAKYVFGKTSKKKPDSIATDPDKVDKKEDSKSSEGANANPDS